MSQTPSDNDAAAENARRALQGSTGNHLTRDTSGSLSRDMSGLLADLRHLCDRHDLDFGALDRTAYATYSAGLANAPRPARHPDVPRPN